MKILMIGDIVGKPGRQVVHQQLPALRERYEPDLVVANAENAAGGSGLTPQIFQKLRTYGVDAVTLGDHAYRQRAILPALDTEERIIRPANLPEKAAGRRWMRLDVPGGGSLFVATLLGRIFMGGPQGDDPFAEADRLIDEIGYESPGAVVMLEIHAEATSEKVAMGHYLDGRVAAVVGSHTHVPTADAGVLPGGTAYITDVGMTGPYDSVLGRRKDRVLHYMTTAMPAPFDVAEGDARLCGVFVEIDEDRRVATACERVEARADESRPPFVGR